ncbi:MAG: hypothetical protein AAGM22_09080, partial [Acidobacteriota bacterium]
MDFGTLRMGLGVWAAAGLLAISAWAVEPPRQLSDLSRPLGEVIAAGFTEDGQWLVFVINARFRDSRELYSMPAGGGAADVVKLGDTSSGSFAVSADGSQIVFISSDQTIKSVPIGGGAATTLTHLPPDHFASGVDMTANDLVLYATRLPSSGFEIFSVPLTGGASNQVSQLPNTDWTIRGWTVSPDGNRIVYGGAIQRLTTLFSAPITGGPPVVISHQLTPGQQISGFSMTPDGSRVIYRAGTFANSSIVFDDLYSVPSDGSAPSVLVHDGYTVFAGDVPGGTWGADVFFYTADNKLFFTDSNATVTDLYLSELDGSAKTSLGPEPLIGNYWWRPEEATLVYQRGAFPFSMSIRPLAGPSTLLSTHTQGNVAYGIATVTPDGQHVAYSAFVQTGQRLDAYGVTTAADPPVRLNDIFASDEDVNAIAATNDRAIFSRENRLVSVPIGGGPETLLTGPYIDRDRFNQGDVFPAGDAVLLEARYTGVEAEELFKVPSDAGPAERVSPPTVEVTGTVSGHVQSAGGQFVFYRANRDADRRNQLYRAPIGGGDPVNVEVGPTLESNDQVSSDPRFAAASNTAVFTVFRSGDPDELWSKTFAGDLRKLYEFNFSSRYEIAPPGNVLIYLDGSGDLREIALATGAERLLEDLATPIDDFLVSEDGSKVVLETSGGTFSLPIAGGTPVDLGSFRDPIDISPDGTWALLDGSFGTFWLASTDGQTLRELEDLGSRPRFTNDSRFLVNEASNSPVELRSYEIATETTLRLDEGLERPSGFSRLDFWIVGEHDVLFTFVGSFSIGRELYR